MLPDRLSEKKPTEKVVQLRTFSGNEITRGATVVHLHFCRHLKNNFWAEHFILK